MITDKQKIKEILDRGIIADILPSRKEFEKELLAGKKLKIYLGVDPTAPDLHLGHSQNYLLLEDFRRLGHKIIILIGDFTACIGDPSDRSSARQQLSTEEVKTNAKYWLKLIKPLLNFDDKKNPPEVVFNRKWLSKLNFEQVIELAANFTVQQMIERDMFAKRLKNNEPIYMHEFFYPLMQGYDSVQLEVDAELCGTDQTFNALAGRTLLKRYKNKDKFVITTHLVANPKTGELMSKSKGTGIFLSWPAEKMYGAIMATPDEMTEVFLIRCTRLPLDKIKKILKKNPLEAKMITAQEIVSIYHGPQKAEEAKKYFRQTFQEKKLPTDLPELSLKKNKSLPEILVDNSIISSKNDWRRLIKEGAIKLNGEEKITAENFRPNETCVLKIGKKRFVRIKI
ncbi:MAG TPA: tyrosine--tRNA ligase [Candidatus Vogelbacteria bacterium]|nr:tyrosine--tRNA ligase [Candidatus Vogelbacteria bacterium]